MVGDSKSAAISALKAAGFKVQVNTVTQAGAAANSVVNQTPAGNTPAPKGSTVTISVTGNSETVPSSILGMTQAQATALLQAAPYNYQVTAIQEGSGNGSYPVGTVYAASPAVGQSLAPGSAITIYIVAPTSTSPSPTPTPSSPSPTPTATP